MEGEYDVSILSAHLFWDVKKDKLSLKINSDYIIERVAYLGSLRDWLLVRKIYGEKKLKEVILNMRYLDDKSLHFYSQIFQVAKEEFRCYKLKQSNQQPSPF